MNSIAARSKIAEVSALMFGTVTEIEKWARPIAVSAPRQIFVAPAITFSFLPRTP